MNHFDSSTLFFHFRTTTRFFKNNELDPVDLNSAVYQGIENPEQDQEINVRTSQSAPASVDLCSPCCKLPKTSTSDLEER